MPLVSVENDLDSAGGGQIHHTQNTVFVNNKFVIIVGDPASPDGNCPGGSHCGPRSAQGSPDVFVTNIPVHRHGDFRICGDTDVVVGQQTVFANEGGFGGGSASGSTESEYIAPTTIILQGVTPEPPVTVTPAQQQTYQNNKANITKYNTPENIENGVYNHAEMEDDPAQPPVTPTPAAVTNPDCAGGGDMGQTLDQVLAEAAEGKWKETGNNSNIQDLYKNVGFNNIHDERDTAWCAAFVGSTLKKNCYKFNKSLMAASYTNYGNPVEGGIANAKKGDILILDRKGGSGHVAFYYGPGPRPGTITVVGGNQSDNVTKSVRKISDLKVNGVQRPQAT